MADRDGSRARTNALEPRWVLAGNLGQRRKRLYLCLGPHLAANLVF